MTTEHSAMLKEVFGEAVAACSPTILLPPVIEISKNCIQIAGCDLGCGHLHVFGSGKAAVSMAIALQNVLKTRIAGGIIVSPEEPTFLPPLLRHFI